MISARTNLQPHRWGAHKYVEETMLSPIRRLRCCGQIPHLSPIVRRPH
uniref:Uncharacterized protein n=1 Tax=uncultured Chloroflexi bacterium HF0200_09I09 TaxID=710736 RepID=E0XU95_9CHLR|nr:hypothetical protein [uncultured Chloroflexi bacterium HF0200_09I09]